jgi:type VI secretion system secreted protein Hcp
MHKGSRFVGSLFVTAFALVAASASAATDIFVKAEDGSGVIKGESADAQHKGEIDALSVQFGDKTSVSATGAGTGRAQFDEVTITKHADRSSPVLAGMVAGGKSLRTVTIYMRKAGNRPLVFTELALTTAVVTSYTFALSPGSDFGTETVTFHFEKIKMTYTPQKPDGTGDTPVVMTWDVAANHV